MSEDEGNHVSAPVSPPRFEGDDGTTTLGLVGKVNNDDIRLAAYQDCGEVNSAIGVVLALGGGLDSQDISMLSSIQHDLYDLTSDIGSANARDESDVPHITEAHVERLERACDHYSSELVSSYDDAVLPGGTGTAALLYQARSVAQRAERTTWTASVEHPDTLSPLPHRYLNRLALLLGILAHDANAEHGDTRWVPMASCAAVDA
ncbi:ATP:cob(I)alamin adenosyltransferase [Solicola gregarius]|uniref:Corrinoid adenosyltransferase n=1 Tax=Solicola gregarius TaxID=2908642 RepID=A0AA46TKC4_9ACTN|nr:ATP:cob(I)alamin adenosyltransferase [Solicola gregarius]UYM06876.1 ATP:cob(I)alamin adenosyltransferase [Solicola gregarius]